MKKLMGLSAIFLGFILVFSSCSTYEEGPMVSLKSKAARVEGTYTVDKVLKNGQEDQTSIDLLSGVEITFEKDGTGEMSGTWGNISYNIDLEWQFNDDKTELQVRTKDQNGDWQEWDTYDIIKLTDTEIWLVEYQNDDQYEYHYVE